MFSGELSLPKSGLTEGQAVQIECIQDDGHSILCHFPLAQAQP